MDPYSYRRQFRAVLVIELLILVFVGLVSFGFWNLVCDENLQSCLGQETRAKPGIFLLLAIVRPFLFTPVTFYSIIAGQNFGPIWGALLAAVSVVISTAVIYGLGKLIGKNIVNPWLSSNLPQTLKFMRSQDWKIVLSTRLIPFLPTDILSFGYGILDFRFKYVMLYSFLGALPESYLFAKLADPNSDIWSSALQGITVVCTFFLLPGLVIEFLSRKRGTGMWVRLKAMWYEILYEIRLNNDVIKRHSFSAEKEPVLLLYGFFSSRRSLTVMERHLNARGYDVISFNLGGLFGVFFTKGIIETAQFVDYKLKRQFQRHGYQKIKIVAHSKGGFVALWWLLKLGGHKYCKQVITMGTPFKGTRLTWLALITPLGFIWRDVWQMRPRSAFLKSLHQAEIPPDIKIYCLYSDKDNVARGKIGIFEPASGRDQVVPIALNKLGHFEFLYRKACAEQILAIIDEKAVEQHPTEDPQAQLS